MWWVPDAGCSLASAMARRRRGPDYIPPRLILLQVADGADNGDPLVSAEVANDSLKTYLDVGPRVLRNVWADRGGIIAWPAVGCPGKFYAPLVEYTGLFRSFAKATADAEGFLGFANQYGCLYGECSLLAWYVELLTMKQAVSVWDLLCDRNERELAPLFKWRKELAAGAAEGAEPFFLEYDSHPQGSPSPTFPDMRVVSRIRFIDLVRAEWSRLGRDGESVVTPFSHHGEYGDAVADRGEADIPHGLALRQKPDALLDARLYLEHVIKSRLRLHTIPTFNLVEGERKSRARKGGPRLKKNVQLQQVAFPRNLLGAIWVQFGEAVREGKEYRPCPECGNDFEVAPGLARSDKHYCSGPCRSRAFRAQVTAAKELRAAGKSVKQIAKRLGAEEKSVEGWLSGHRKEGNSDGKKEKGKG
jgi:hypothetical protein